MTDYSNLSWKDIFFKYNYFFFFMMVMYMARGNIITQHLYGYFGNTFAVFIPFLLTIIFMVKNKINFNSKGFHLISISFLLWFIAVVFKYNYFIHQRVLFLIEQLIMSYCIVAVFNKDIFPLYEKIVTKLTIICLIVWSTNLVFPNIWDFICQNIAFDRGDSISKYNFFFASILNREHEVSKWYRNPGFSWEPGMYSCILIYAIFFNLARTKCQLKGNRNLYWLILGLVSTFSTTGYFSFICCIIPFIVLNRKIKNKFLLSIILLPLALYILQLDFMTSKILSLQSTDESLYESSIRVTERNIYTPQRFDCLVFETMNISNDPLLGYGIAEDKSFVNTSVSETLYLTDGLLKLFATYGLLFGSLLTVLMLISSLRLKTIWNSKATWMLFVIYEVLSISYPFFNIPIVLAFIFFNIYITPQSHS